MFELSLDKQQLLTPLLTVSGAVDRKQSLAILSNILIKVHNDTLWLTATDLEIEVTAKIPCLIKQSEGAITVPARKFVDIIRSLDEKACPTFVCKDNTVFIKEGRSQFKLTTLPANNYPCSEDEVSEMERTISRETFMHLLQSTHFAMAQQDVRVFLNGLLFEMDAKSITTVATDGHRMAICKTDCQSDSQQYKLLLPKKGVQELLRLLNNVTDETITISAGSSHFRVVTGQYTFMSKLLEARFPPYLKAIPKQQDKHIIVDCENLKKALSRMTILAHEKSKAVLLHVQPSQLTMIANNQEQEEASETLEVKTEGDEIKVGINATYLLDVLHFIEDDTIRMSFSNPDSSILVESMTDDNYQYILMPMKI